MSDRSHPVSHGSRFALILAGGKGVRFKSSRAKVLHALCGKPLLAHILDKLVGLGIQKVLVVVGHQAETVTTALGEYEVDFVMQPSQLGTGHAVMTARAQLQKLSGSLLVLYGDTPFIRTETLRRLFETLEREAADQVLLTAEYENPYGYGRMIRNADGEAVDIVEENEAAPEQKAIREINAGFNCFKISSLLEAIPGLSNQNKSGEYYLTDILRIFRETGKKVVPITTPFPAETYGINTSEELAHAESRLRSEIARKWLLEGVTILNPSTVLIDKSVVIGPESVIYPGVILEGKTQIGSRCTVYSYSHLKNAVLEEGVIIDHCSVVRDSKIGRQSRVGPFAHLRQNCLVSSYARIGNFVEVKQSKIGKESKAAHLAYLGDAEIGCRVNIGAGTIICNYDGIRKNRTVIEDQVFIGSGSQLVAPVTIGKDAYVAAGSAITEDVPESALGIARTRQVNKKGWARQDRTTTAKVSRNKKRPKQVKTKL